MGQPSRRSYGLGLQIVEMLVKQLSGTFNCRQDEKITFTVQVPLEDVRLPL